MELGCQRADDYSVKMAVHLVLANDYNRPNLIDLAAARGVEVGQIEGVTLDGLVYQESSPFFRPSASVTSRSLQSSRSRAISL